MANINEERGADQYQDGDPDLSGGQQSPESAVMSAAPRLSESFSPRLRSIRDDISAGTRPNASTATVAIALVNAKTVASIGTP